MPLRLSLFFSFLVVNSPSGRQKRRVHRLAWEALWMLENLRETASQSFSSVSHLHRNLGAMRFSNFHIPVVQAKTLRSECPREDHRSIVFIGRPTGFCYMKCGGYSACLCFFLCYRKSGGKGKCQCECECGRWTCQYKQNRPPNKAGARVGSARTVHVAGELYHSNHSKLNDSNRI